MVQTALLPNQFALHSTLTVITPAPLPFQVVQSLLQKQLRYFQNQILVYVRLGSLCSH